MKIGDIVQIPIYQDDNSPFPTGFMDAKIIRIIGTLVLVQVGFNTILEYSVEELERSKKQATLLKLTNI